MGQIMIALNNNRNPLFNNNRLKLGTFGTNTIGSIHTIAPDAYRPTWENTLRAAQAADSAGFEAILALARWKNSAKVPITHRGGVVLDPFAWAAGLAMATTYSAIIATSHAPTVHPLIVAKQSATIDHISGGRFGLNVVGGWNRPEFDMFGLTLAEHDTRYDYLDEWLDVLERLWSGAEEFDFEGKFLKLRGAMSMPQPLQQPRPVIMNAGFSQRGQRFACQHADFCFVSPDTSKDDIASYKRLAREEFGREVGVWTQAPIVQRSTRQDAEDFVHYFAVEHEDRETVDAWVEASSKEIRSLDGKESRISRRALALGGQPIVGNAIDVADQLQALSETGIDGVLLAWFDFDDGLKRFNDNVMPLLEQRGLRESFEKATALP
jgi:alkanesulfonate monooxygenase SsuD/methylene tetrahydromethanopterin reductase-like flavin-dependent oxidoreductase (luciferase family)